MSTTYIRKPGAKPIHILGQDGSTRCFPGRYDTSEWDVLTTASIADEREPRICANCIKTPADPGKWWDYVRDNNEHLRTVAVASKPTRRL